MATKAIGTKPVKTIKEEIKTAKPNKAFVKKDCRNLNANTNEQPSVNTKSTLNVNVKTATLKANVTKAKKHIVETRENEKRTTVKAAAATKEKEATTLT